MIITPMPIIIPMHSGTDPCAECECPCHYEDDGAGLYVAVAGLVCFAVGGATAFFQWTTGDPLPSYGNNGGDIADTVVAFLMGGAGCALALILVGVLCAALATVWSAITR